MKISFIRSNYRLFKSSAKKLFLLFFYLKKTSVNYRTNTSRSSAIVNMDSTFVNASSGRFFLLICTYLKYCGFDIITKTNWEFFKSLKVYKKLLLQQKFQLIRESSTPINTVTLVSKKKKNKLINICYGYSRTKEGVFDCVAPFPIHPGTNKFFSNSTFFSTFRESERIIKVFFSGNADKDTYRKEKLLKEFNVLSRWEVINFILNNLEKNRPIKLVENTSELYNLMNSEEYLDIIVINTVKTVGEDWLKILSKADFFICPPGISKPWCHNSIEAMSVGTIPILQYADLFTPVLENNKNCLIYTNFDELHDVIVKALEMNEREISIMRNEVIKYYCSYLSIECIEKKINEFIDSDKEQISVALPFVMSAEDE